MAVSTKAGVFTIASTDTVGTTQAITCGFQPKAIFFWWMGDSSATDAITNQTARYGFGFASSTTARYACGTTSLHSAANVSAGRALRNDAFCVTAIEAGSSGADGLIDISSFDANGFTTIVDDQLPATLRISYMAIGGGDITDVSLNFLTTPAATGNFSVTGLTFQPNFVLFMTNNLTTDPNIGSTSRGFQMVGAAVSSSQRGVVTIGEGPESNATSENDSYAYDAECIAIQQTTPTTVASRADFVSFNSDGYTVNFTEVTGSGYKVPWIAIKGGNWVVGSLLTQTDTTTDIVESGFGFQPAATMLFSHNMAKSTQDTPQSDGRLSIGAFTSTSERTAQAYLGEDNLANTDNSTGIEHDEVYLNISTASAVQGLMDVKSVDSNGFTLIMDDADPTQSFVWYFSVGAASSGQTITATGLASKVTTGVAATTRGSLAAIQGTGVQSANRMGAAASSLSTARSVAATGIKSPSALGSLAASSVGLQVSPNVVARLAKVGTATASATAIPIAASGISSRVSAGAATSTAQGLPVQSGGIVGRSLASSPVTAIGVSGSLIATGIKARALVGSGAISLNVALQIAANSIVSRAASGSPFTAIPVFGFSTNSVISLASVGSSTATNGVSSSVTAGGVKLRLLAGGGSIALQSALSITASGVRSTGLAGSAITGAPVLSITVSGIQSRVIPGYVVAAKLNAQTISSSGIASRLSIGSNAVSVAASIPVSTSSVQSRSGVSGGIVAQNTALFVGTTGIQSVSKIGSNVTVSKSGLLIQVSSVAGLTAFGAFDISVFVVGIHPGGVDGRTRIVGGYASSGPLQISTTGIRRVVAVGVAISSAQGLSVQSGSIGRVGNAGGSTLQSTGLQLYASGMGVVSHAGNPTLSLAGLLLLISGIASRSMSGSVFVSASFSRVEKRTYDVPVFDRVFDVPVFDRVFDVAVLDRVYEVPDLSRVYDVLVFDRIFEIE